MTEAIKALTFINIVFIILLALSGMLPGVVGEIVYYLAFILPIGTGFYISKGLQYKREEVRGLAEPPETLLSFDIGRLKKLLPLIFPAVMLVFLFDVYVSILTIRHSKIAFSFRKGIASFDLPVQTFSADGSGLSARGIKTGGQNVQ